MLTCTMCRYQTELSEMVVTTTPGHGVCLSCYESQAGHGRRERRPVRRRFSDMLAA